MKKIIIISSISIVLVISIILGFILFKNNVVSTITLDINPSIEIGLDKNNKVIKLIAINEDAKKIVNEIKSNNLNKVLEEIVIRADKKDNNFDVIIYTNGKIKNDSVIKKIEEHCSHYSVSPRITIITKISSDDIAKAKKYKVNPAKIVYLKNLLKENSNLKLESIVSKSISELNEILVSGYYCDDGYTLEGTFCLKEKERKKTSIGKVCPEGYYDYNGVCHELGEYTLGNNDVCDEDFTLENGECVRNLSENAQANCYSGKYDFEIGKCIESVYSGDAYEYCRITPGEDLLYNGRCLGRKPTINGGCLGSDSLINGYCYDTSPTSGYAAEWVCPNGEFLSNADGTLKNEDKKCYEIKVVGDAKLYCNSGWNLEGNKCIRRETNPTHKERICSEGYRLVNNDMCINNNTHDYIDGAVCDYTDSKLIDNICIIYEIVDAKQNKKGN